MPFSTFFFISLWFPRNCLPFPVGESVCGGWFGTQSMYPVCVCGLDTINISIMYCLFLRSYVFFIIFFPIVCNSVWHTKCQLVLFPLPAIPLCSTFGKQCSMYSRVSFYDGSGLRRFRFTTVPFLRRFRFTTIHFLWPLSSRTEHSWLEVRHCRNWSVLSLLSALLALFRCAGVSYLSILVQFF